MNTYQAKALAILNVTNRQAKAQEVELKRDKMRESFISSNEIEEIFMGAMRRREYQGGPQLTTVELQELINTIISERFAAACSELAGLGLVDAGYDSTKPEGSRIDYFWRDDLTQEENVLIERICSAQREKLHKTTQSA